MKTFEDAIRSITYWRDVLGLQAWTIKLEDEPAGDDALACMYVVKYRKMAVINLGVNFFEHDENEKEKAILHELLHIHTRVMMDVSTDHTEHLSCDTQTAIHTALLREMEYMTDALVEVIYELDSALPMKRKPKRKLSKKVTDN